MMLKGKLVLRKALLRIALLETMKVSSYKI